MTAATKPDPKGLSRLLYRIFNYAQDGGQNLGFFFQIVSLVSIVYVAFEVSGLVPSWLPYAYFFIVAVVLGVPALALFGWFYQKRTPLYGEGIRISTESNPYTIWKLAPKDVPLFVGMTKLLEGDERPWAKAAYASLKDILRRNGIETSPGGRLVQHDNGDKEWIPA